MKSEDTEPHGRRTRSLDDENALTGARTLKSISELRDAGRELLELRRQCYQQQADDHADMAEKLTVSATMWEQHEQDAARDFGGIVDGGR